MSSLKYLNGYNSQSLKILAIKYWTAHHKFSMNRKWFLVKVFHGEIIKFNIKNLYFVWFEQSVEFLSEFIKERFETSTLYI